jgi:hypothetical protein
MTNLDHYRSRCFSQEQEQSYKLPRLKVSNSYTPPPCKGSDGIVDNSIHHGTSTVPSEYSVSPGSVSSMRNPASRRFALCGDGIASSTVTSKLSLRSKIAPDSSDFSPSASLVCPRRKHSLSNLGFGCGLWWDRAVALLIFAATGCEAPRRRPSVPRSHGQVGGTHRHIRPL